MHKTDTVFVTRMYKNGKYLAIFSILCYNKYVMSLIGKYAEMDWEIYNGRKSVMILDLSELRRTE